MGSRWRDLEDSAELSLNNPSAGVKLLEDRTQLINSAVGRGDGQRVTLKMIRLPRSLAAECERVDGSRQAPSSVGTASSCAREGADKENSSSTTRHERASRPTRGRGRARNRGCSPTRRPAGLEGCRTEVVGEDSSEESVLVRHHNTERTTSTVQGR